MEDVVCPVALIHVTVGVSARAAARTLPSGPLANVPAVDEGSNTSGEGRNGARGEAGGSTFRPDTARQQPAGARLPMR